MAHREALTVTPSPDEKTAVKIIEDIAEFFRSEWLDKKTFEGWPFLPNQLGKQPTAGEANAFLLGCCIDYRQRTRTAWRKAEEFCNERVGLANRDRLWRWIADHDRQDWDSRWAAYGYLHPTPARHRKLYAIADTLVVHYGGDARQLWSKKNVGRLKEILQNELAVGPQITRMIIGGLRDHRLINITTGDLKADTHVIRLMNAMGLSKTANAEQVAADGRRWFKKDPWFSDSALYHLGASYNAKTKADVLRIYRAIDQWRELRSRIGNRVERLAEEQKRESGGALRFYPDSSLHWVGLDLVEMRGALKTAMHDEDTLWAWAGFGFDGKLVSASAIGGSPNHFGTAVKAALKAKGFAEDAMSAEARRGNVEYYAEHAIDRETLRQSGPLKRALSKQVHLLREIFNVLER